MFIRSTNLCVIVCICVTLYFFANLQLLARVYAPVCLHTLRQYSHNMGNIMSACIHVLYKNEKKTDSPPILVDFWAYLRNCPLSYYENAIPHGYTGSAFSSCPLPALNITEGEDNDTPSAVVLTHCC